LARRTKRRPTSTARKRGSPPPAARPPVQPSGPAEPDSVLRDPEVSAAPEPTATFSRSSLLPRRQSGPTPAAAAPPATPPPSVPPAAAGGANPSGPGPAATTSFLPRKGPAGRAQRQRQRQANLEPLGDTAAVPSDRTPYLWLDLRRVMLVSAAMIVLVIVGFIVLR